MYKSVLKSAEIRSEIKWPSYFIIGRLVMISGCILILMQIKELLEKYPVWKEYKDQKHDLFLNDRPISGYLTGIFIVHRAVDCALSSFILCNDAESAIVSRI